MSLIAVKCVRDKASYFAEGLYKSMKVVEDVMYNKLPSPVVM